jgi:DNA-binding transcriptional regulator LsrR (DeoR family)
MPRNGLAIDSEDSLAIRAAWLHYAGGLTQAAVAKRLGIANVKAHRLITRATQNGAIKVTIDGDIAECVALETELAARFGLEYCEVTPDLGEEGLPIRTLGVAGAAFLRREISGGQNRTIGLGHGRTLSAAVNEMPRFDARGVQFVSLLGGLTRNYAANPHDVMHRIAEKTGAAAYVMPVPFFANTLEDRSVLLSQRGVSDVFGLAASADLKVVGIGTSRPEASLVSSGMIEGTEIRDVQQKGGVGEMLGHFFDAQGAPIETMLTERTLSIGLDDIRDARIVALAGGDEKTGAIRSVLMSGCLSGLITDERTAMALVKNEPS